MSDNLESLVRNLIKESKENEWLEFKKDNADAQMIGKDISALANGAALLQRDKAYMLWGIDDSNHSPIGTKFSPYDKFQGNQELISWLHGMLSNNVEFAFKETFVDNCRIVVLTIKAAIQYPVAFQKSEFIRDGSYTKKLIEQPALQSQLWDSLRNEKFELTKSLADLKIDELENKIDTRIYFDKLSIETPSTLTDRLKHLERDQIIVKQDNGLYSITNFGAILLSKDINDFNNIKRKEIRVVRYKGINRNEISISRSFEQGYAVCISDVLKYIDALLPSSEPITDTGERVILRHYPPITLRELLINALIHQDLTSSGNCVTCEIFDNRIEITNPGELLVEKNRIVDLPPKSRNELLSKMMRRMHLCEELGTGWDRVVALCEKNQLPSPEIIQYKDSTRVILYSHIDFFELTKEQRLWACYLHACILWGSSLGATNATLRTRFGVDKKSSSAISRLLKEAVANNLLKMKNEAIGTKAKRYIPYWA